VPGYPIRVAVSIGAESRANESGRRGILGAGLVEQRRFVILSAVENAKDQHVVSVRHESDHRAFAVVGDPNPGTNVITSSPAHRKSLQALAIVEDSTGVSRSDLRRGSGLDVLVDGLKLLDCAPREFDAYSHERPFEVRV
jgi:hypothetical protein